MLVQSIPFSLFLSLCVFFFIPVLLSLDGRQRLLFCVCAVCHATKILDFVRSVCDVWSLFVLSINITVFFYLLISNCFFKNRFAKKKTSKKISIHILYSNCDFSACIRLIQFLDNSSPSLLWCILCGFISPLYLVWKLYLWVMSLMHAHAMKMNFVEIDLPLLISILFRSCSHSLTMSNPFHRCHVFRFFFFFHFYSHHFLMT